MRPEPLNLPALRSILATLSPRAQGFPMPGIGAKKHVVRLSEVERVALEATASKGIGPAKRGPSARFDFEYGGNGTANRFMLFAPLQGRRQAGLTDQPIPFGYAHILAKLRTGSFRMPARFAWSRTTSTPIPWPRCPKRFLPTSASSSIAHRCLARALQPPPRQGQVAVHHRRCPRQTQAPLPVTLND